MYKTNWELTAKSDLHHTHPRPHDAHLRSLDVRGRGSHGQVEVGSNPEGESGGLGVDDLVTLVTAVGHVPRVARTIFRVTGIDHRHLTCIHYWWGVHCSWKESENLWPLTNGLIVPVLSAEVNNGFGNKETSGCCRQKSIRD